MLAGMASIGVSAAVLVVVAAAAAGLVEGGGGSPSGPGLARPKRGGFAAPQFFAANAPLTLSYTSHLFPAVAPLTAVAELRSFDGGEVTGRIAFVQPHPPGGPVFMTGNVTGLSPGKHGLHVHALGDTSNGCQSMGGHYNPHLVNHGGPADPYRHVGDLGNIEADEGGVGRLAESDHVVSLVGAQSILGRGLVVHEKPDDLGRGGDMESLRTGNAGGRLACGVIAWAEHAVPPQSEETESKAEDLTRKRRGKKQ